MDVMDGNFVPNITFGPQYIKELKPYSTGIFDTHLMVKKPLQYIKEFAEAGSDYITFHIECDDDPKALINEIKKHGKKAGIALKPNTPVSEISHLLNDIDLVLIMTVEPGFCGQKFMPECVEKIAQIKAKNGQILVSVDGGIDDKTAKICKEKGANVLVSGSFLVQNDIKTRIKLLKNA
jgi:ribulose-phosphate 3-epimerase